MARILVVEDDPNVRALLRVTLEDGGHRVEEASDGQEGWERLPSSGAELVVLDLNMPRMDGWTLCRKLRQAPRLRELPVLMLTVRELVEDQVRGYDAGADEYLTKPFDGATLLARIDALLKRASPPSK